MTYNVMIGTLNPTHSLTNPGGPGLASTRMSPFWILLELRVMEMVVTTGAIRQCKASVSQSPTTNQHPGCCVRFF